jgi:hypothetical protein
VIPDPEVSKKWVDRACDHWEAGDIEGALACCREALASDPANVDALANTGTLLLLKGDAEGAEKLYLEAHAIAPRHIGVLLNIAGLRHEVADLPASLDWIKKAESIRPNDPDVLWRKALIELALGDYAAGWKHYEVGLGREWIRGKGPGFATPPWDGSKCDRLLLWHEQGLGDTLQFVRYAKLCRERARKVLVLCPKELIAILESCPYVDGAVGSVGGDDFDRHISIMSLPHLFGTTLDTIPTPIPYLFADPARASAWAPRVRGDRLKVGLVWAGNFRTKQLKSMAIDRSRSLPLTAMQPWLDLDGVDFYSLQKGEAGKEARGRRIADFMDEVSDFADTAAIVQHLDLVISVDTSVVHLAGAMGKPVWVLSRLDACWRWLRNRLDSPWYPGAKVFGQQARGDWSDVIDAVTNELSGVTTSRTSS